MSFHLNALGSFQFENLIRNRIPFLLLNLGVETQGLFPVYHQSHLDRQTQKATPAEALAKVREAGVPAEQAIVLLCENGKSCERVASQLENAGYSNVYWIQGGIESLRAELQKS